MMEYIAINKLRMAEYNPREIRKDALDRLKKSLSGSNGRRMFEKRPCLVNKRDGLVVYGGNQRLRVAKELGWKEIPCDIDEISLEEERERNIKDNLVIGDFDVDILANNFDIQELDDWGMDLKELELEPDAEPEEDEVPETPKEPRAKRGDIFQLGRNRLMCGDSTKIEDVEKLMDGNECNLLISSPPYWNQRDYSHWDTFESYLSDMCLVIKSAKLATNGIIFWNIGDDSPNHRHISAHHSLMIEGCGFIYIDAIVWKKQGVTGIRLSHQKTKRLYYPGFSFEQCLVFQKNNTAFPQFDEEYAGQIPVSNVWEIATEGQMKEHHSAPFPVKLPKTAIMAYTNKVMNKIYEPFCGSGSTLIACEQTNRICYGMEIDPKYCDVIIERYCNYVKTNKEDIYMQVVQEAVSV